MNANVRDRAVRDLTLVASFDGGRDWNRLQERNHFGKRERGTVKCHHISGAHDHKLHVLAERDLFWQAHSFAIAAAESPSSGDCHGFLTNVLTCIYLQRRRA
jgi:hypothetical protein